MRPEDDGITHINVYSKAQTELGRWMSNFAHTPFTINDHGTFASVEGYWYWLGCRDDQLRTCYGFQAKKLGRELPRTVHLPDAEFQHHIALALEIKAKAEPRMLAMLKKSTLPFAHYYVFANGVKDAGYKWILEIWDAIRRGE